MGQLSTCPSFLQKIPRTWSPKSKSNMLVKILLIAVAATVAPVSSQSTCGPPRPVGRPFGQAIFGCECSSFVWNNGGVNVGLCQSVDLDGQPMCYLHQPNNCPDAKSSQIFCNMQVSKTACLQPPPPPPFFFSDRDQQHHIRDPQSAASTGGVVGAKTDEQGDILMPVSVDEDGVELY